MKQKLCCFLLLVLPYMVANGQVEADKKEENLKTKGAASQKQSYELESGVPIDELREKTSRTGRVSAKEQERRKKIIETARGLGIEETTSRTRIALNRKDFRYEEYMNLPREYPSWFIKPAPVVLDFSMLNYYFGGGLSAEYLLHDVFSVEVDFSSSYGSILDYQKDVAIRNKNIAIENKKRIQSNNPLNAGSLGILLSYHVKNVYMSSVSKMSFMSNSGADSLKIVAARTRLPEKLHIRVNQGVHFLARAGFEYRQSAYNLSTTAAVNDVRIPNDLYIGEGNEIKHSFFNNLRTGTISIGGGINRVRNFGATPRHENYDMVDDTFITVFADFLYAPMIEVDELIVDGQTYDFQAPINSFGFRAGIEGKFSRKLSWGYRAELGMRPGISQRGLYTQIRVFAPILSSLIAR